MKKSNSSGSGGGGPVIKNHKKMAAKGDRIDFTFLAPPPAAGSATVT